MHGRFDTAKARTYNKANYKQAEIENGSEL